MTGHAQSGPASQNRAAWNASRRVGAKCSVKLRQIWVAASSPIMRVVRDRPLVDVRSTGSCGDAVS